MKVRTKEPDFKPIQITIETQEEYDLLYNLLNCSVNMEFGKYMEGHMSMGRSIACKLKSKMWKEIDNFRKVEGQEVDYHD